MTNQQNIGHVAVPNIGAEPAATEQRDAIHMAVAPVIAASTLVPGQRVGFLPDGRGAAVQPFVGIVDPFLKTAVLEGQRFWLLVEPNTITSLRHQWSHPAFQGETESPTRSADEEWLRDFADDVYTPYERLMEGAAEELRHPGNYPVILDIDTPNRAYSDIGEFWKRYRNVTHANVPEGYSNTFISCSC